MLRSSILQSRQLLSSPVRQRTASQWLSRPGASNRLSAQRFFADNKSPASGSPTPASPSSESPVPPKTASKINEQAAKPPPPPPAKKTGRFRRFLLYLILTSGLAYGGGVFMSLKSDNFHDFFTEYVPYGEECVLYFEERDFYRRFPNASRKQNREPSTPVDAGSSKVTIPSKAGLKWKVTDEEDAGADVSQKGPHMSAVNDAKNNASSSSASQAQEKKSKSSRREKANTEKKGSGSLNVPTIELAELKEGGEGIVQEMVKTFNDIVTVISADEDSKKYSAPIAKAKEEIERIGEKIVQVREDARKAAQDELNKAHETFDESARELIRRFENTRAVDAAQYREEFEAEREKLASAYQDKIRTELQRAQEVAERRLQNELVEQAIELNRKYVHNIEDLVEKERNGRLSKLNELTSSVTELENLTTGWREVIDTNLKTQQLQVAVDAVRSVLDQAETPRPFVRELVAVKELASDDQVVEAAIGSINPTAYQRGIPSTSQLIERFRRVASEVRKASLLPEDAGVASHAASFVLSKVMFKRDAVADGNDVESVLVRTENLLEEGHVDAAAREMNTLQGWAKILSKDWMGDVRRVLEVKQALEVIETEARLECLRVE